MKIKLIGITLLAINVSACSTIVNGSNQTVAFNTAEVTGASCELTGGSDFKVNEKFTTPAEVEVPRSKKALQLGCSKPGYQTASKTVNSRVEGTTGGNLLFGGFIGAGVDAATGALYKYPETVVLNMEPVGGMISSEPIAE